MTLKVDHWSDNHVTLSADCLTIRSYIEILLHGWHLHLETKNNGEFDLVNLSHQELLTKIYEIMNKIAPTEGIHWADVWLYMRIANAKTGNLDLESCSIDSLNMPPTFMHRLGPDRLKAGTKIRVTHIKSENDDYQRLVGVTGRAIAPITGLMSDNYNEIMMGLEIDPQYRQSLGEVVNLVYGDRYEVVK